MKDLTVLKSPLQPFSPGGLNGNLQGHQPDELNYWVNYTQTVPTIESAEILFSLT
jgi:hypothetical protein